MSGVANILGNVTGQVQTILSQGGQVVQIGSTAVIMTSDAIRYAGNSNLLKAELKGIDSPTFSVTSFNRDNANYYVSWNDGGTTGQGFYEVGLKSDLRTGNVSTGELRRAETGTQIKVGLVGGTMLATEASATQLSGQRVSRSPTLVSNAQATVEATASQEVAPEQRADLSGINLTGEVAQAAAMPDKVETGVAGTVADPN
jgi:hypothetical protein